MARKKRVDNKQAKTNSREPYHPDGQRSGIIPLRKKTIPTILPRNIAQEDYLYQLADS